VFEVLKKQDEIIHEMTEEEFDISPALPIFFGCKRLGKRRRRAMV